MIRYRNECCDCAVGCYPCNGQHKKVPYFVCDNCKEEYNKIYRFEGQELCESCVIDMLEEVVSE